MIKDQKYDFTIRNERLQTIIDNILDLIIEMDLDGKFIYISPQSLKILGYTPEELIGRKSIDFIHPDDIISFINVMRNPPEYNKSHSIEFRMKQKSGSFINVSAKGVIINQNDKSKHIIVVRDISYKIISEKKVQESEQQYRKILESIGDPIQVVDNNLRIIMINASFKEWINRFGLTSEIFGKNPLEIFPFLPKKVADEYEYVFESGQTLTTEECILLDDKKIYTETKKIPILTNGKVTQIITILRDITEKKKSDRYFEESEEKFRNIANQSFMSIAIIQNGLIKYFNKRIPEINGYSSIEIKNWKPFEFLKIIHPDDKEFVFKQSEKKMAGDKDVIDQYKYRLIRKTGEIRWIELFSKNISYRDKPAILAMSIDITDKILAEQKLQESEEKYRNLFEDSPYMIFLIDLKGKVLDLNQTAIDNITYTKEDMIGTNFSTFDIMRNKNLSSLPEMFKKILKNKFLDPFEIYVNSPKIKPEWLKIQAKIVYIGEKKYIQVIVEDISGKKKAEEKLKESEARYRLITENSNDLIRVLNEDFNIEFFNEVTHMNVLGYSKEEMLKYMDVYFNHPDDYRKIISYMLKVFKTGEGFRESRLRHKNGKYIWFEVRIKCFKDEQEQQKYLFVYRDIDERKKAEKKLKESEKMYRNLYENSPIAIVISDDKGKILEQNQASEKIFGYQNDEIYGNNFQDFDIFNPKQIQIIKNTYKGFLQGFKAKPREMMIKNKDGKVVWINWQLSIIRQNELNLVETLAHDITEEKKVKLLIEEENEKLLELNKMKNELVSRVSHELKTPLNSVYGGTQILLNLHKKDLNPESLEFVEMIHKGGKRLKKLIESLLDTSRIDSNKLFLDLQEHNLTEIIKECVEDLMYFAGEREIEICLDLPDNVDCEIDRLRIEQVITNLLSNAIKNTQPSGVVKVSLSTQGNNIYVSVEDTGVGLTADEMDKLFNKFGKIERYGKRLNVDIEGSGLGLFITKEIVDLHNGSIWVESEGKNHGSKFTFKINKYHVL